MSAQKPTTWDESTRRAWRRRRRWVRVTSPLNANADKLSGDRDEENECLSIMMIRIIKRMMLSILRWTGLNTLLSTQLQLTHTTAETGPRTTWATPTAKEVTFIHSLPPRFPPVRLLNHIHLHFMWPILLYHINCFWASPGFFYNIIRVPPPDETAAKADSPDFAGAEVICSIPAAEPRKPSYYHSFGEMETSV